MSTMPQPVIRRLDAHLFTPSVSRTVLVACCLALSAFTAFAQSPTGSNTFHANSISTDCDICKAALVHNDLKLDQYRKQKLAIFWNMTKDQYDTFKRSASGSAEFTIDEIPIAAFVTYDEMKQAVRREAQRYQYDMEQIERLQLDSSTYPVEAFKTFADCIGTCAGQHKILAETTFTGDDITVRLSARGSAPFPKLEVLSIAVDGAKATGGKTKTPALIPLDSSFVVAFKWDPSKDLGIAIATSLGIIPITRPARSYTFVFDYWIPDAGKMDCGGSKLIPPGSHNLVPCPEIVDDFSRSRARQRVDAASAEVRHSGNPNIHVGALTSQAESTDGHTLQLAGTVTISGTDNHVVRTLVMVERRIAKSATRRYGQKFSWQIPPTAKEAKVTVTDADGKVVKTASLAAEEKFSWPGHP